MLKGLRKRLAVIFTAITGAVLAAVLGVSLYFTIGQITNEGQLWFSNTVDQVTGTVLNNSFAREKTGIDPGDYIVCVLQNGQPAQGLLAPSSGDEASALGAEQQLALFTQTRATAQEQGLAGWVTEQIHFFGYTQVDLAEPSVIIPDLATHNSAGVWAQSSDVVIEMNEELEDGVGVSMRTMSLTSAPAVGTDGIFTLWHGGTQYRATYFNWTILEPQGGATTYEIAILQDLAAQNQRLLVTGLWYALLLLAGLAGLFLANWFLAKLVLRPTAESLRRQTEFVAAASHELRSPLAVIRSSLSAAESAGSAEEAGRFQSAAGEEAERMSHLVDDMLLLAGGDAGSWPLNKAPVDLDTLLISVTEDYTPLAKQQQTTLRLDLPDTALPKIEGDAERLRQILAILLDNALRYAPPDTAVEVTATHKKGRVRICVADHGQGIPDEEKEKVFQRFYRADKSRHSKANFGLGLSIARELARLHGGKLAVYDTQNGGATFILTL